MLTFAWRGLSVSSEGGSAGVVLSPSPLPWHTIHSTVTDVSEDI